VLPAHPEFMTLIGALFTNRLKSEDWRVLVEHLRACPPCTVEFQAARQRALADHGSSGDDEERDQTLTSRDVEVAVRLALERSRRGGVDEG
jgi:hypothetical protein